MELLGSGNGMANGSPTLHYSSPILRLIYDTYMSSNSLIGSGFDLGSLEFYGKMGSNSGVGAKIVATTSEQWGGSVDDYPSELQFHTASNGTASGLTQRMVISSEGSVGIGTNDPLKPLELSGDDPDFRQNILSTSSANLVEHEFTVDNNIQSSLFFSKADSSFTMRNKTNGTLHLGTDNSNDLSIATGGAVTIGDLAGAGSRMVVTDANGQLSTAALPLTSESDPQVGTNTLNYIPKWNGSNLTTGTIFDNGSIGIGESDPDSKLEVTGRVHAKNEVDGEANLWLERLTTSSGYGIFQNSVVGASISNYFQDRIQIGPFGGTSALNNKLDVVGAVAIGSSIAGTNNAPADGMLVQGSVGIGETAPDSKLEVSGRIHSIHETDGEANLW